MNGVWPDLLILENGSVIRLHRLIEQVPELVVAKQVQSPVERLMESPDERTRITVKSILRKYRAILDSAEKE